MKTAEAHNAQLTGKVELPSHAWSVPRLRQYICTECGGDATVAWANDSDKDIDCFGAVIHPKERLCLACAKKRGNRFF